MLLFGKCATYLYIVLNLSRIGDKMITFLLRDCAIYVPIGINNNYYQVTGTLNCQVCMLSLHAEFACHLTVFPNTVEGSTFNK